MGFYNQPLGKGEGHMLAFGQGEVAQLERPHSGRERLYYPCRSKGDLDAILVL